MTQTATEEAPAAVSPPRPATLLWPQVGLWALGALILFLYSRLWRPIWLDEFLHYAMGGMTLDYALKTVDYTTIEVNHGQTGVYMLVDYLLLQAFGASAVALRLPSLVSAAVLLAAAVTFVRMRGFGYGWRYLVLLALAGHSFLMYFTGEARPYMALAASAVAVLAYYQYDVADRRRPLPLAYGIVGICIGALMHPYIVYLIVLLLPFSIWLAVRDGRLRWSAREIVRFANPVLLGVGAVLVIVIGQLTWMRRVLSFGYDPYALIGSPRSALELMVTDHFANPRTSLLWIGGMVVFTFVALAVGRFRGARSLLPPLVLILIGLASSVAVSALSALRTYWILERQWVAGIALVAVGSVWLFAELFRAGRQRSSLVLQIPAYLFIALTVASASFTLAQQASDMATARDAYAQFTNETRTMDELRPAQINDDNAFIYAANVNAARGGDVWPMFVDWYDNLAGMRPEFREKNPSWSGFLGDQRTLNNG